MLILIYGNSIKERQKKIKAVLNNLKEQKPNALFSHLDFLDLSCSKLDELITTTGGLFEEKNITLLSNIFRDINLKKCFLDNLDRIKDSENAFILTEDKLTPTDFKQIKKYSLKTFSFQKQEIAPFNIFILSDLLQKKDVKNLWINYHEAKKSGLAPEQIFSNFFFSLKSLSLAQKLSEEESGMKTYPYKKASTNLNKWKNNEIDDKIFLLISYYNSSRLDSITLDDALEKFILEL